MAVWLREPTIQVHATFATDRYRLRFRRLARVLRPSSVTSSEMRRPEPLDRSLCVLIAEDNPISAKILETLLTRMGIRCIVVTDGAEAISVAMGDISKLAVSPGLDGLIRLLPEFDCILMDLHMPIRESALIPE